MSDWPYQLTANFIPVSGPLSNRQVLIDHESYFRLLELLTDEQRNELHRLAHNGSFRGISVRVTTTDDAQVA